MPEDGKSWQVQAFPATQTQRDQIVQVRIGSHTKAVSILCVQQEVDLSIHPDIYQREPLKSLRNL